MEEEDTREGGTMVWLQLPEKGRWAPSCNWWLLGWGSPVCPFANSFEQWEVLGGTCPSPVAGLCIISWGRTGTVT